MKCLVWVVSGIMLFIYCSVFVVCIVPHADFFFGTVLGYLKLTVMSSILGMIGLSYYRAITTPPGRVPRGWRPPDIDDEEAEETIEKFKALDSNKTDPVCLLLPLSSLALQGLVCDGF